MGKKRGKKAGDATEHYDASSSASTSTFADLAGGANADDFDDRSAMEIHVDALYEKRASTREAGLSGLVALLENFENSLDAEAQQHTLTTLFTNSIKRGGAKEQELATRALGLLCMNLGCSDETHSIFQSHGELLQKVARAGKSAGVRVVGNDVLALVTFIACEDHRETAEVMQQMEAIFQGDSKKTPPPEVAAAAARGWALLLTTQPRDVVRRAGYFESRLAMLSSLLHEGSVELREAAGEAIAALYDAHQGPVDEDGDAVDAPEGAPDLAEELEAVRQRMAELARNMGDAQRRSKKDRSAQKSAFKEVLSILDGEAAAEVKLKLRHGDVLYIDTVAGITQLNAIRHFLAGGFQGHLQHNPLLHDVFEFQPQAEAGERMSKTERRLFKSPNSAAARGRQKNRGSERAAAAANRHSLLGESW